MQRELEKRQFDITASHDDLEESSKSIRNLERKLKEIEEDTNKRSKEYRGKIAQLEVCCLTWMPIVIICKSSLHSWICLQSSKMTCCSNKRLTVPMSHFLARQAMCFLVFLTILQL